MIIVKLKHEPFAYYGGEADITPYRIGEQAGDFHGQIFPGFDEPDDYWPGKERTEARESGIFVRDEDDERVFYIKESPRISDSAPTMIELSLDPSLAFGDGRHPTTEICIHLLGHIIAKLSADERWTPERAAGYCP